MSRSRSMPLAMACDVDALFCESLRSLLLKLEICSHKAATGPLVLENKAKAFPTNEVTVTHM